MRPWLLVCTCVVAVTGCEGLGFVCNEGLQPGIYASVTDASTRLPVIGDALVIATSPAYADTAYAIAGGPDGASAIVQVVNDVAGTYVLTIEVEGYEPWRQDGIEVREGACNVEPVRLDARLQPLAES